MSPARLWPLAFLLILPACVTRPPAAAEQHGNVSRLLAHPQFHAAAIAAPDFTTEALRTAARLEHDLTIANAAAK